MTRLSSITILCSLRGNYNFSPNLQQLYIDNNQPFDPLVLEIKHTLKNSGITLVDQANQAHYILQINKINQAPVLQSTSTTNQISTYLMQYTVAFSLTDATGKVLIPQQQVTSSASYTISSTQLSTNFTSQPELLPELRQDVIFQLMNRLSSNNAKKALAYPTVDPAIKSRHQDDQIAYS
jgi:LPS-assembly lipoprotein